VAGPGRALHVTFALAPVRVVDVLHAALDAAAERDVALRRALPVGWENDAGFAAAFAAGSASWIGAAFDAQTVAAAAQATLADLFAASRNDPGTAFDQLAGIATLSPASILRLNDRVPSLVRERATTVELLLPGKSLGFPPACAAALAQLRAGPVRFADLDLALSSDDRRRFVAALVREGLMLVDEP
jgi:hypothetical protein